MSTITKERIELFIKNPLENGLTRGEQMELARIALASLEAEAVAYMHHSGQVVTREECCDDKIFAICCKVETPLYAAPQLPQPVVAITQHFDTIALDTAKMVMCDVNRRDEFFGGDIQLLSRIQCRIDEACRAAMLQGSQPVSKREQVRREHAEWSDKTFGDVGPVGPLKHLSKEALEAAAEPDDLSEWADMQFLLWDAQRRAGISDGEITAAMEEKLKVNMARQWPEPKDGEPRQHLKPAPQTVPDSVISAAVNGIMATYADNAEDCREMVRTHVEQACRAAIQESGHG
ncbi:hypothetical protein A1WK_02059 [Escherichia coli KTE100]|nr:hypothetical protein A1WK_02059 [Escherichia coli KTE100]